MKPKIGCGCVYISRRVVTHKATGVASTDVCIYIRKRKMMDDEEKKRKKDEGRKEVDLDIGPRLGAKPYWE